MSEPPPKPRRTFATEEQSTQYWGQNYLTQREGNEIKLKKKGKIKKDRNYYLETLV